MFGWNTKDARKAMGVEDKAANLDMHHLAIHGVAVVAYVPGHDWIRLFLNQPYRDLTRTQARELAGLLAHAANASEPGFWDKPPFGEEH